jgi:FtsH-binding integral membrane protein
MSMSQNPYAYPSRVGVRPTAALSQAFLTQAFIYMFLGLLVTTVVGVFAAGLSTATLVGLAIPVLIVQLVVALGLMFALRAMPATIGMLLFFVYSALMGLTMGIVLQAYALGSVLAAGASASAVFGGAAFYGAVTKRDLTQIGGYLFMGLIGLVVASVVNLFVGWTWLSFGISVAGVLIFTVLTAYDVQRIQRGDVAAWAGSMEKGAVMAAFKLYLDFINLFFFLLRLFGSARD